MRPESLTSEVLAARHGFFTRRGGVSEGPYASLNCSLSSADAPEAVAANRAAVAESLGASYLLGLTQVHGVGVATVTAPWLPGQGPRADAVVTNRKGIAIGVVTADCAPVLLEEREAGVVAAVHAGWRGAVAGVLEAALEAMAALGAVRERVRAAVGPCIGQASYQVRADLRDAVLARDAGDARFFLAEAEGFWRFDLAGYCASRLEGVASVEVLGADTAADPERFFSHRRRTLSGGGPIGHQVSAIRL